MAINEHLTFSWGHIIAFVAIIVVSYFSFLGLTYLTDGQFIITGVSVLIIDIILISVFIGVQALKATTRHFKRKIIFERLLIFLSPFALAAVMYPACHFWTVFDNRGEIESTFTNAVQGPKTMFQEYETYCNARIDAYTNTINSERKTSAIHKENEILSLKLQLLDQNYANLKKEVFEWVDNKAGKATVWNVFLIANIKSINAAISEWNQDLIVFSEHILPKESAEVQSFDSDSASLNSIVGELNKIKAIYGEKGTPTWYAILMITLCYIFLMLPYIIQRRNTKSTYHLFYTEKVGNGMASEQHKRSKPIEKKHPSNGAFTIENPEETAISEKETSLDEERYSKSKEKEKPIAPKPVIEDEDEYGSFTM